MNENVIKLTDNELLFLRDELRELVNLRSCDRGYYGFFDILNDYDFQTNKIIDYLNRLIVAKGLTKLDYTDFIERS